MTKIRTGVVQAIHGELLNVRVGASPKVLKSIRIIGDTAAIGVGDTIRLQMIDNELVAVTTGATNKSTSASGSGGGTTEDHSHSEYTRRDIAETISGAWEFSNDISTQNITVDGDITLVGEPDSLLTHYAGEDQHHAAFVGLEDNAGNIITPEADNRIRITDDGVINADKSGNYLALSIAQGQIDHGSLGGLNDDDHTQYLLVSGSRAMAGGLDMGTNAITNVGNVDGVDVGSPGHGIEVNSNVYRIASEAAGNGLQGGSGSALAVGTPGTVTTSSANNVTADAHTHAATTTADGAANHSTILQSGSSGELTVDDLYVPDGGFVGVSGGVGWTLDDTNGDISTTDNVGIGTANVEAGASMEIALDGGIGLLISDSGDSGNYRVSLGESSGNGGYVGIYEDSSETRTAMIRGYASSGVQAYFTAGNVGIGTDSPSAKLAIDGGVHVGGTSDPGDNNLLVDGDLSFDDAASISTSAGNLTLSPTGDVLTDSTIATDNWSSGLNGTGWGISYAGHGDFRNLYSEEIRTHAFIAEIYSAMAGALIITQSRARVSRDFTIPNTSSTATLYVEDLEGFEGSQVFSSGDYILLRVMTHGTDGEGLVVADVYGTVTSYSDLAEGEQSWTFTTTTTGYSSSDVIYAGSIALDYGQTGSGSQGVWAATVLDAAGSPYSQVQTWDTVTDGEPDNFTTHTRVGNLDGISGIGAEYGLWAGTGTTNTSQQVIASDSQVTFYNVDLNLHDGSNTVFKIDHSVPSIALGTTYPTGYGAGDGFWAGLDSGTYKFRVGDVDGELFDWDGSAIYVRSDSGNYLKAASGGIEIYNNDVKLLDLTSNGEGYFGDQFNEHVKVSSSGTQVLDGATVLATYGSTTTFYDTNGDDRLVLGISGIKVGDESQGEYIDITESVIEFYQGGSKLAELASDALNFYNGGTQIATYGSSIVVGEVAASKSNVQITAGAVKLRTDETDKIVLDTDGNISLTGLLDVGSGGGIRIGSGTKDSNLSGWYMDDSEIVGQDGDGDDQVVLTSTGIIQSGDANIRLNRDKLQMVKQGTTSGGRLQFTSSDWGTVYGEILQYHTGSPLFRNVVEIRVTDEEVNNFVQVFSDKGMRISAFGSVLTPDAMLDVEGDIKADDYIVALGGLHVGGISDPGTDNLIVDGDVGIGTTGPGAKLEVRDSSTHLLANFVTERNGTDGAYLNLKHLSGTPADNDRSKINFFGYNSASSETAFASIYGYSDDITGGAEDGGFGFLTFVDGSNTEVMRIKDGNVGIGTTSPSAKLAIDGGVHVGGTSDPGDDNLEVDGGIGVGVTPTRSLDVQKSASGSYVASFWNTGGTSSSHGINMRAGQTANPTAWYFGFFEGDGGGPTGSITGDGSGGVNFNQSSDIRRKNVVRDIKGQEALKKIGSVDPFVYTGKKGGAVKSMGFAAQDFIDMPGVTRKGDDGFYLMDYTRLIPVVWAGIQGLLTKVEDLEKRIAVLEGV